MPTIICGVAALLIGLIETIGTATAANRGECAPVLAFKDIRFSEMQPPTLERKWTAIISVDASRCQANSSGYFQIILTRISEVAPDLEFRDRYAWRPPSVDVAVSFAANEAVERYWIGNVTPCACRD